MCTVMAADEDEEEEEDGGEKEEEEDAARLWLANSTVRCVPCSSNALTGDRERDAHGREVRLQLTAHT